MRPWDADCGSPAPLPTSTLDQVYEINGQLGAVADKVHPVTQRFPAVYAGLVMQVECNRVVVYRVPSAEFDRVVAAAVGADARLVIRDAKHSEAALLALLHRISADRGYWKTQGIDVNSVGPAPDGSGLIVGTMQVDRVRMEFPLKYGTEIAFYVEEMGPAVPL